MNVFISDGRRRMPKIIDDLRETFILEARRMLQQDGGRALTIRNVAATCHVAVGTVYNYFRSKDELMAYVVLEDWQRTMADMRAAAASAPDVMAGLRGVYDALYAFQGLYQEAWRHYAASNDAWASISQRHDLLIGQLVEVLAPMLGRFGVAWTAYLPTFLAETLLSAATRGEGSFDRIVPILTRLTDA